MTALIMHTTVGKRLTALHIHCMCGHQQYLNVEPDLAISTTTVLVVTGTITTIIRTNMNTEKYHDFVETTFVVPEENQFAYLISGIASEGGEVAGAYAKYLRGDFDLEELVDRLEKEMGDVLYMMTVLGNRIGITLDELMASNVLKLSARKNEGAIRGDGDSR